MASVTWTGTLRSTHYWDCNGQGCDAATLQPWDPAKPNYWTPAAYGPQNPANFGGAVYGERMWLVGAASDALATLMGDDDGCCGSDADSGGCGRCAIVRDPSGHTPPRRALSRARSISRELA